MSSSALAKFNMIEQQMRPWEVLDGRVLATIDRIDRVDYVSDNYKGLAYADCQIPLNQSVRMLPPTVEGRMLQALLLSADDTVLEIGCGCGYTAACLGALAKQVTSIDVDPELVEQSQKNLQLNGVGNVTCAQQNYTQISEDKAFDGIAVTASLAQVPQNLKQALTLGGRLFVVVGESPAMQAMLVTRVADSEWTTQSLFETDLPRLQG